MVFFREELDQKLDYLFIDEAGQISLAHFVAMGMSAKNIILVGDQMQLGQPIQGSHPGSSECPSCRILAPRQTHNCARQGYFPWDYMENAREHLPLHF